MDAIELKCVFFLNHCCVTLRYVVFINVSGLCSFPRVMIRSAVCLLYVNIVDYFIPLMLISAE